jgi:polypeptide N-acetylgalactosaminyltransferase
VLIFLDSHCEASAGWAEPLLARIAENERYVICPVIDSISDRSMDYHYGGGAAVGGFHWTLDFTWIYRPLAAGRTAADPMPSPTMAGGLFAIHRRFWEQLGKYDLGMGGWGGENLELSFRIWTCGGELEIHPCSHVGHIFRGAHPVCSPSSGPLS